MRFKRGYWINGRWWPVVWADAGPLGACVWHFRGERYLQFHRDLREQDALFQRTVLYHELLHAKWERHKDMTSDDGHYKWTIEHDDFARYAAVLVQLEKEGHDGTAASLRRMKA